MQFPAAVGHLVTNEAIYQGRDGRVVAGVADEGVGNAVLDGPQVDVRKRRLGYGADDTGDTGQLVGQRLVERDVTRVGPLVRGQDPQSAIPFPWVQCQEVGVGEDVPRTEEGSGSP